MAAFKDLSPEDWLRVEALFDALLHGADPDRTLAQEADLNISTVARQLWANHHRSLENRFLEDPIHLPRAPDRSRSSLEAGRVLASRFLIVRLLGAGGMGEVYLAEDSRLRERVALKTIRADFSDDATFKSQFLAEIQNARRVTHRNVCRIFDLFDDNSLTFFTMEYVDGERLSERFRRQVFGKGEALALAIELAEGLQAAHSSGVVHGDFKPGNVILPEDTSQRLAVITDFGLARALDPQSERTATKGPAPALKAYSLRAGTPDFMAPELLAGSARTVRSDVFAYGKVLSVLLPGNRLVEQCTARNPEDRPESLAKVISSLRPPMTRRLWITSGATVVAVCVAGYQLATRPRLAFAGRQRVIINAFRPRELDQASVFRSLLITALRQSPLVLVVSDEHIQSALGASHPARDTPIDRDELRRLASREQAALVLDGTLEQVKTGLKVLLQAFSPSREAAVYETTDQVATRQQIVMLADRIALRLRREIGESETSLRAGYVPLEVVTSASPEAVEAYFRGVREYESARSREAETWFDEAIRLDPGFALAHLFCGIALASRSQVAEAIPSYERAYALRSRLSDRERLWIESRYFNIIGDYTSSLNVCRRLVVLFPEEPIFQRNTAFALARVGRPRDALPFNQRSVELDSSSDNNLSELIVNHSDALLFDDALALVRRFRSEGHQSTLLEWGAGIALMGKEQYDEATGAFDAMAASPERERWAKLLKSGVLPLQGRFESAASSLRSDLAYDAATGEQTRRATRLAWLGIIAYLMGSHQVAAQQIEQLLSLDASPAWLQPTVEAAMLALWLGETGFASQALEKLRFIEAHWPSTHSRGSRLQIEGALLWRQTTEPDLDLPQQAAGLWPDPLVLLSLAEVQMMSRDFAGANDTFLRLYEQRGRILRMYFPGLTVLSALYRARCLHAMSRFADARRLYEWVLARWWQNAGHFPFVRQIHAEYQAISPERTKELP